MVHAQNIPANTKLGFLFSENVFIRVDSAFDSDGSIFLNSQLDIH